MCAQEKESDNTAKEKVSMPYHEQVDAFTFDLEALIGRYSSEFELTRETMVGCLFTSMQVLGTPMIMDMGSEMLEEEEDDGEAEVF